MPEPTPPPGADRVDAPRPGAVALRAALPGVLVAAVGGGAVIASGVLQEGGFGWSGLGPASDGVALPVAIGCAAAAVLGAVGIRLKTGAVLTPAADPQAAAQRLQVAVFGDFVLQLLVVGGGTVGLYVAGAKFPSMAGFALAFATVALVHQLGSGLILAGVLRRRSAAVRGSGGTATGPDRPASGPTASGPASSGTTSSGTAARADRPAPASAAGTSFQTPR